MGKRGDFHYPIPFLDFDPSAIDVTKLEVLIHLPNLSLHFWSFFVFEDIINPLGKTLKTHHD